LNVPSSFPLRSFSQFKDNSRESWGRQFCVLSFFTFGAPLPFLVCRERNGREKTPVRLLPPSFFFLLLSLPLFCFSVGQNASFSGSSLFLFFSFGGAFPSPPRVLAFILDDQADLANTPPPPPLFLFFFPRFLFFPFFPPLTSLGPVVRGTQIFPTLLLPHRPFFTVFFQFLFFFFPPLPSWQRRGCYFKKGGKKAETKRHRPLRVQSSSLSFLLWPPCPGQNLSSKDWLISSPFLLPSLLFVRGFSFSLSHGGQDFKHERFFCRLGPLFFFFYRLLFHHLGASPVDKGGWKGVGSPSRSRRKATPPSVLLQREPFFSSLICFGTIVERNQA